jgi:hypothetical protein
MSNIFDYTDRTRTLEEVALLLQASLEIKMLKGKKNLWQVKLEKVKFVGVNPTKVNYACVRNNNPNAALSSLCQKLSYTVVKSPDTRKIRLAEVNKGPLYIRLHNDKGLV